MPPTPSFGHLPGGTTPPAAPAASDPFRVAVLADLSGRAKPLAPADAFRRKPVALDPDDVDAAVAAVGPSVSLSGLLGGPVALAFMALDDFHPDAIYPAADKFDDLDGDEQKSEYMRAILRHPRFRPLEAAWRGIDWLAKRSRKADRRVDLVLYDLTPEELAAGLNAADDLSETPAYKALITDAVNGPKGQPWAAFVVLHPLTQSAAHIQVLGRLAKIAAESAAPVLAGLAAGEPDVAAWAALRQLPESALIGVAAPGFLLRPPFGDGGRSIEKFEFEEFTGADDPASYLWACPALAPAAVLTQNYVQSGWGFRPAGAQQLTGMATHTYRDEDGDAHLTLVEKWLDRKAAEKQTAQGVMSVLGTRGQDVAELSRLHAAVAVKPGEPPADLFGRWGGGPALPPPRSQFGVGIGIGGTPPSAPPPPVSAAQAAAATPAAPAVAVPTPATATPADDGLDPELAALLGGLDGAPAAPPAEDDGLDPELAALLNGLDNP